MQYTYEFELFRGDGFWIAVPFDMDGATQGSTIEEASEMAADWLRMDVEHRLMRGIDLPKATFGHEPQEGGILMVVSVEAGLDAVKKVSASEAARMLGVTPARVTAMIKDGLLDAYKDGARTWVTVDSIDERKRNPGVVGRPKKAAMA